MMTITTAEVADNESQINIAEELNPADINAVIITTTATTNGVQSESNMSGLSAPNEVNTIQSIKYKSTFAVNTNDNVNSSANDITQMSNANNSSLHVNVQLASGVTPPEKLAERKAEQTIDILHAEEKQPPVFYTPPGVICGPLLRLCHSSLLRRGVYVSHHQRHRLLYHPELLRESHYNLSPFRHCAFLPYLPERIEMEYNRQASEPKRINTLVLDLDETLVHCSFQYMPDADAVMTIEDAESVNNNNSNSNSHSHSNPQHLPTLSLLSFTTTTTNTTTTTTTTTKTNSSSPHRRSRRKKRSALVAAYSGPNVSESNNNLHELTDGTESPVNTKSETPHTNSLNESTETILSIKYRPHLHSFLRFCLQHFEVILFSAAEPSYVKVVVDAMQRDFEDITFTFADNYNIPNNSNTTTTTATATATTIAAANESSKINHIRNAGDHVDENAEILVNTSHEPVEYPCEIVPKCGVITVLHRDYCTPTNAGYTKDLYLLGRDLRRVILLDNSAFNSIFQPFNCIQVNDFKRVRRVGDHTSHHSESKESYDSSDTLPSAKKVSKVIKSSQATDKYNAPAVVTSKSVDLSYSIVDWVNDEDNVLGELIDENGLLSNLSECNNVLHYITRMYLYNRQRCKASKVK